MNFIVKIEDLINKILLLLHVQLGKIIPAPIKAFFARIGAAWAFFVTYLKASPVKLKDFILKSITYLKETLSSIDFKGKLVGSYQAAMEKYKQNNEGKKSGGFKKILLTPFLILGQWLQGLSATHSLVLMGFTGLSILSVIGIGFSGNRLLNQNSEASRTPASVEVVQYERPDYYKKQTRFLDITNIRLPVYFVQVNEIRSVDIDFSATLSNRKARMVLEKLEFQLRDHLVLNIEPVVSSFPLEEEGKEIIRKKLQAEINEFMLQHQVEGEVKELKITYILAN